MSTQPEALRLADELEVEHYPWPRLPAAAELRRLHAQRDALLEALRLAATNLRAAGVDELDGSLIQADLAIAKAEEGK